MEHLALAAFAAAVLVLLVRERAMRRRLASLEQRAKSAEADAGAKTQLATVGELVSGLARELKTPLQGVLGNTEVMLATGAGTAQAEELRDIRDHAARAADIVRNLIAFSDSTALARRWQDLNEVAARAVDLARPPIAAAGNAVAFTPGERIPVVYVDGRQLERSLAALLGHAGAVPPPAGAALPIAVSTRAVDDHLIVDIDIPGVSQDTLEQAVAAGELEACRHVIRAHGGRVAVDSRRGGAGIEIELPAALVDVSPEPPAAAATQEPSWTTSSTSSTSIASGTSTS